MLIQKIVKKVISPILIPLTQWYLSVDRKYYYQNIDIQVLKGVFHPGLFVSTGMILKYLEKIDLKNKKVLEIGCGTGLISIFVARKHAQVTALDISQQATKNTKINAQQNQVELKIIQSNLFENLEPAKFDYILINPPYYPRNPQNEAEFAWLCGENFVYFQELFQAMPQFIHLNTRIIMVLSKGCNIDYLKKLAVNYHFTFEKIVEKNVFFDEKNYLFQLHYTGNE